MENRTNSEKSTPETVFETVLKQFVNGIVVRPYVTLENDKLDHALEKPFRQFQYRKPVPGWNWNWETVSTEKKSIRYPVSDTGTGTEKPFQVQVGWHSFSILSQFSVFKCRTDPLARLNSSWNFFTGVTTIRIDTLGPNRNSDRARKLFWRNLSKFYQCTIVNSLWERLKAQYFVTILIKKEFCAKIEQNQYNPFRGSMMGRGLLWVQLVDHMGQKWTFMTSHLESTKGTANLSCGETREGSS